MSRAVAAEVVRKYQTIEPCPECGSPSIQIVRVDAPEIGDLRYCECMRCRYEGPDAYTNASAVCFWNREVNA